MKTTIFSIPTVLLLVSTAWASPLTTHTEPGNGLQKVVVKQPSMFAFLRTHRQAKGVTTTWGMASYEGIACFTIQRTYEDPTDPYAFWEDLSVMPCNARRSYSYNDNLVFPGMINYRVVANMTDGSSVTSDVSTVRIVSRK
jgi:hypothetical protein